MDFSNLFSQFTSEDSIFILIVMLAAFLLGILLGYVLRSRRVMQLKRELKEKKKALAELNAELENLREQLNLKEADLKKLSFNTQEAEARAERLETEKEELNKQIFQLKRQLEEGGQSDDSYQSVVEELNAEVARLQTQNEELRSALQQESSTEDNLAEMQSTYNATRQRMEILERRLDELAADNAALHEKMRGVRAVGPGVLANTALQSGVAAEDADHSSVHPMPGLPDAEVIDEEPQPNFNPEKTILADKIEPVEHPDKDDLTKIEGIGPFLQQQLNNIGVYTYEEMSTWDSGRIEEVTEQIGYFPGRIEKDNWVQQAAQLASSEVRSRGMDAPVAPLSTRPTDLTIIEGIDQDVEEALNSAGIETWGKLAATSSEDLLNILEASGFSALVPISGSWPTQARLASSGDWAVLREYQDELRNA